MVGGIANCIYKFAKNRCTSAEIVLFSTKMEVAIEKCVQFWLSNNGAFSNVKSVDLPPESLLLAGLLDGSREKATEERQWKIARNHLKTYLRKKLSKGQEVELKSDYDPCLEISKALIKGGLRTFMSVPCKSRTVIDPVTFEVWQTTVGEELKIL